MERNRGAGYSVLAIEGMIVGDEVTTIVGVVVLPTTAVGTSEGATEGTNEGTTDG